jgi:glycosyltransferase involved in cell wall biosynthesis
MSERLTLRGDSGQMSSPLVSILINNYNYCDLLGEAIDSALDQTYPRTEIVVVDDGSTDGSQDVIKSYGSKIIPILKNNGGQGSTFNAGFAASTGEIVCFLDADDVFLPHKVARIANAWRTCPGSSLIYHLMQSVNAAKEPMGRPWPSGVWRGDIRQKVESSGGWWPCPTTSGLAASRRYLERVLPMPIEPYRLCGEAYIAGLAPFFGPVVGISEPLAMLRLHAKNNFSSATGDREQVNRKSLDRVTVEFGLLREALEQRFHISTAMSLNDNYAYHYRRWLVGESGSVFNMLKATFVCPSLPSAMKVDEIANIVLECFRS